MFYIESEIFKQKSSKAVQNAPWKSLYLPEANKVIFFAKQKLRFQSFEKLPSYIAKSIINNLTWGGYKAEPETPDAFQIAINSLAQTQEFRYWLDLNNLCRKTKP